MRRPAPRVLLAATLLALPAAALAEIGLVGGKPVKASFFDDGNEVIVNPYNSRNRAMTWNVQRVPRSKVKDVRPSETPEEEYCRRAYEIREGEAAAHRELAAWCAGKKLKDLADREWERALECDPDDAEARKALGEAAVKAVMRRNPRANRALGEILKQYLETESGATRRVLYERAVKEHGLDLPACYLERAWRSARKPKGRTDDVPLTLRSKEVKGPSGVLYTMFVPSGYDPLRPAPLVLGLHGGGQAGKDGKAVEGSGPSAMNFYQGLAEERGWLVACPTAIQAPWSAEPNGPFLDSLLEEVGLLYNVDLNRVYLTGHSMGGFGTWFWGPKWADRWAAIAPMAGGGGPAAGELRETQTFAFVFHGTDDKVVGVQSDRSAAEALLKGGNDFAYTELNGVGHGCPEEVLREMAEWFEVKRLAVRHGGKTFVRSDAIRSSFVEKPTKVERDYLGSPELPDAKAAAEKPEETRKRLLDDIRIGGGKAEDAAAKIGETKDAKAVEPLAALLRNPKGADDVRSAAARALGLLGFPEGLPALESGLDEESDRVYLASLRGIEAVGDRKSGPALLKALDFQAKRFQEKLVGGSAMDFSDYEARCAVLGATSLAAAALADPALAVARIHDRVVKPSLEANIRVAELARAGNFPRVVRSRLGKETAEALGRTKHPSAPPVLAALRALFKDDAAVTAACDAATERK